MKLIPLCRYLGINTFSSLFQEMQIKGKKFNQLHWLNYAVVSRYKSTGKTQQTEFNVKDIYSYPPLYFSRVKSYGDTESIDPMKQI